ncbi:hypothetical protein PWG71_14910 [Nocardiopsis sp. N85]|uniref:hypothetical protein n=1 Tax=Nocardiopsis sp. N85 TaxID=3029400 RepID=UPI00237F5327|nr:hypothetical protein [Nocardiopsis sp. N85]MDE3722678.1 hypothetical protein [Nocardiopsis sp. N85]
MGPLVRAAVITAGVAVVSVAAIGGGLWAARDDPDRPHPGDVHTSAPDCGDLGGPLDEHLPGAVFDLDGRGPLSGGEGVVCRWTSAGTSDDARQGALRVEFSALFTDPTDAEPVPGADRAREAYEALTPGTAEAVALPTGEGQVWRGGSPGDTELAFFVDNLLVRVSYAAVDGTEPVGADEGRDTVVAFAERIGEGL